ncbi:DsbA family protein [Rahnella bonaserana]|jgi:thiol:disulfide interchange protein DsbA|uniref:Thiol:disulfide interchange protein n=1 Tax=Rahnella bonaserana TaxID=2816248 RepID=A0ABS6LQK6_9GAMM|nr:DsbA family protein [Rahnella bonaserana]MBU9854403.1 DsbA family protein [Rahnella bonaserana]
MLYQTHIKSALVFLTMLSPFTHASEFKSGQEYQVMSHNVSWMPDTVEFFSFYCRPCYLFNYEYHIGKTVSQNMPENTHFVKYHVSSMGSLGNELTEAWAVAMVLGIEDKIEKPLFDGIQKNHSVTNAKDIEYIFNMAGVSTESYENVKNTLPVKSLIYKQNEAAKELRVNSTPSVYVSGKYFINNGGVGISVGNSVENYTARFSSLVNYLLITKP